MARDYEGQAGVVLMTFVLGAIAGAAAALLWAPTTGKETRQYLNQKARESRDKATVAARRGRELVNEQGEQLSTAVNRGRKAYQRARQGSAEASEGQEGSAEASEGQG